MLLPQRLRLSCLSAIPFLLLSTHALADNNQTSDSLFKNSRLYTEGNYTNNDSTNIGYGEFDYMLPVSKNNNHMWYTDFSGRYGGSKGWALSAGVGYRVIVANSKIWGAYLMFDQSRSPCHQNYSVFNPGLEYINNAWDVHINGYLPADADANYVGQTGTAVNGSPAFVQFSGHNEYNPLFDQYETPGRGADLIFGRRFKSLSDTRVFAGSYLYGFKDTNSIVGFEGGVSKPIGRNFELAIRDSYDYYNKNSVAVSFSITFGGVPTQQQTTIQDHLLDLVRRHLGTLNQGDFAFVKKTTAQIYSSVARSNIWFFNPAGGTTFNSSAGTSNCTFEHPCAGTSMTQTNIDAINTLASNANLYVNSGTVNIGGTPAFLTMRNGMNLFGRSNSFTTAATSNDRPLFNGGFYLLGNNSLNNLRVNADNVLIPGFSSSAIGVGTDGSTSGEITINDSDITSTSTSTSALAGSFDGGNVTINNSTLTASTSSATDFAVGASAGTVGGTININNSTLNATTTGATGVAQGLAISNNEIATVSNATITANSVNGRTSGGASSADGIIISNTSQLTLNDSTITTNSGGGFRGTEGIKSINTASATMNNDTFTVTSSATGASAFTDIANTTGTGTLTFNNSTLSVDSTNTDAFAARTAAGSTVTFTDSDIDITGDTGSAVSSGAGTTTRTGGTCSVNGGSC
ncbi:MAG: hypothetical protein P1U40_08520 [Coxiellaceae bacterium]|nr:hypothetical protein [Coxiellaceae bacterium]